MAAQSVNLVLQRLLCNLVVLRGPLAPVFPMIAAAPAGHDQNSAFIGEVKKLFRLKLSFKSDRVQSHVQNVIKFITQASRIFAQHHVSRPTAATNQNLFAIHGKEPLAVVVEFGGDFTNAELGFGAIRGLSFNFEIQLRTSSSNFIFELQLLTSTRSNFNFELQLRTLNSNFNFELQPRTSPSNFESNLQLRTSTSDQISYLSRRAVRVVLHAKTPL